MEDWMIKKRKRNEELDSYDKESIAEFLARGGKIEQGPKPKPPKDQLTKARNARLNGMWDGTSSSRKGF